MVARSSLKKADSEQDKKNTSLKEDLKKTKDGKVQKASRPIAKRQLMAVKAARLAISTGKVSTEEQKRKIASDLRTLYVRFKRDIPRDEGGVRVLLNNHPDIKFIRIPRQNAKNVKYAYVEFGSEAQCDAAKESLTTGASARDKYYIDFVGQKSKGREKPVEEKAKSGKGGKSGKKPINDTRLFIKGIVDELTKEKLKKLFPKCNNVSIPNASAKKGSKYAFVQFSNPVDANAAFDASQKLTITPKGSSSEGCHLTVVYAKQSKRYIKKMQEIANKKKENLKEKKKGDKVIAAKSKDKKAKTSVKAEVKDGEDVSKDEEEEDDDKENDDEEEVDDEEHEAEEGKQEVETDEDDGGDDEEAESEEEVENDDDDNDDEVENDDDDDDDDDDNDDDDDE